jgi:hypothetical protein
MKKLFAAGILSLALSAAAAAGVIIDFTNGDNVDYIYPRQPGSTATYVPFITGSYWAFNQSYLSLAGGTMMLGAGAATTTDDSFSVTCLGNRQGCGPQGVGIRSRTSLTGDYDPGRVDDLLDPSLSGAGEVLSLYNLDAWMVTAIDFNAAPFSQVLGGNIYISIDGGSLISVPLTTGLVHYGFASPTTFSRIDMQSDGLLWPGFSLTRVYAETPEPGSIILLASGILALAAIKFRR